jgi:hypothetical protein
VVRGEEVECPDVEWSDMEILTAVAIEILRFA